MREDHHTYEAHTESAADHFCDRCFGHHRWDAHCPEDDSIDEELIDFEPITDAQPLQVDVDAGGPASHRITAWRVPREATEAQIKEAMHHWIEPTYCHHEHDCCGHWYAGPPKLLGRTVENNSTAIVFVFQTYTMNV
jgi:hypothetical protein